MKKVIFSILFFAIGFSCFAEQKCNKIPEEYEKTKEFKWSEEKHGTEYFENRNWEWRLGSTSYLSSDRVCGDECSPCIVMGFTCVHYLNPSKKLKTCNALIRYRGRGQFKLYTNGKNTDKFYELLCETANKNPDEFFRNLKKKMGKNMKWAYSIGSGDDKIPCYELFFEDNK